MDKVKLIETTVTEILSGCLKASTHDCVCWPPEHVCFSDVPLPDGGTATFTVPVNISKEFEREICKKLTGEKKEVA
jgi:hypothetical protein